MISPVVKTKPNTKGQFLRASDNATCVKGLPTTGATMLPKLQFLKLQNPDADRKQREWRTTTMTGKTQLARMYLLGTAVQSFVQ